MSISILNTTCSEEVKEFYIILNIFFLLKLQLNETHFNPVDIFRQSYRDSQASK